MGLHLKRCTRKSEYFRDLLFKRAVFLCVLSLEKLQFPSGKRTERTSKLSSVESLTTDFKKCFAAVLRNKKGSDSVELEAKMSVTLEH